MIVSRRGARLVALPAPASSEHRWHPSVDRLVDSALKYVEPDCLVGVLMTGMGDDGAAAMTRLRQQGGRTIAVTQQEISEMVGMSRESINKQLRAWAARNWVRLEHGAIVVLNLEPLQEIAGSEVQEG